MLSAAVDVLHSGLVEASLEAARAERKLSCCQLQGQGQLGEIGLLPTLCPLPAPGTHCCKAVCLFVLHLIWMDRYVVD